MITIFNLQTKNIFPRSYINFLTTDQFLIDFYPKKTSRSTERKILNCRMAMLLKIESS